MNDIRTTTLTREPEELLDAATLTKLKLKSLAHRIGTFAGGEDYILRIRNGQIVPPDAGSQGAGQN